MKKMMLKKATWIDCVDPDIETINTLIEAYSFHELDREAILEDNQTARVDTYEKYLFVVLHFPKYDAKTKRYIANEFNIFISKKYLISIRHYTTASIDRIINRYEQSGSSDSSPGYLLYEMIDGMLDKVFRMLAIFSKELHALEGGLISNANEDIIRKIMIKKRNIITLKHMMKPQIATLRILELRMNTLFNDAVEVYFENLEDKFVKIFGEIELLQENVESMEETMQSIFDMQTNLTIKYLTIFSAFMLPLTLITSFFGMNIAGVPFQDPIVYIALGGTVLFMILVLWYLRKKNTI